MTCVMLFHPERQSKDLNAVKKSNKMIKVNISGTIPTFLNTNKQTISDLIKESISNFDLTGELEIEIMFVDKEKIRKLNNRYRKVNQPTDVLSFPLNQFAGQKINFLGSLVVCGEIAAEKNENVNEVIKHGLLHLLGYDHEKNQKSWREAANLIDCSL